MKYKYLIAEGPKALEIREKAVQTRDSYSEMFDAVFSHLPRAEHQSVMIIESFGRVKLYGVAYKNEYLLCEQEKKEFGLKNAEEQNHPERTIYVPNLRFKAGKGLAAKMEKTCRDLKTFQQLLVEALDVQVEVFERSPRGLVINKTGIWEPEEKGKIYIRIPIDSEKPLKELPGWLREPQGEEWKHCAVV